MLLKKILWCFLLRISFIYFKCNFFVSTFWTHTHTHTHTLSLSLCPLPHLSLINVCYNFLFDFVTIIILLCWMFLCLSSGTDLQQQQNKIKICLHLLTFLTLCNKLSLLSSSSSSSSSSSPPCLSFSLPFPRRHCQPSTVPSQLPWRPWQGSCQPASWGPRWSSRVSAAQQTRLGTWTHPQGPQANWLWQNKHQPLVWASENLRDIGESTTQHLWPW